MTFKKKIAGILVVMLAISSVAMVGMAHNADYTETYVGNATEMDVSGNYTYTTISDAINNTAPNGTINVQEGNYTLTETVNVTHENITVQSFNNTNVFINATNTTMGYAFDGNGSDTLSIGQNITIDGNVFASGGSGGSDTSDLPKLTKTYYGIPLWAFLVVVLLGLFGVYEYEEN